MTVFLFLSKGGFKREYSFRIVLKSVKKKVAQGKSLEGLIQMK